MGGGLRREASTAPKASIPFPGPDRRSGSVANAAARRSSRRPTGRPAQHFDPFDSANRVLTPTPPDPHPIAGSEELRQSREGLRGLENETIERLLGSVFQRDLDMPSPKDPGGHCNPSDNSGRRERVEVCNGPGHQVVAGSLIRAEQQPPIDRFGRDRRQGGDRTSRVRRPEPEEDRAVRVGSNEQAPRAIIVAKEQVGPALRRPSDTRDRYFSMSSDSFRSTIRQQLPGRMSPPPCQTGRRAHQPFRGMLGSVPGLGVAKPVSNVGYWNHLPDGLPIQRRWRDLESRYQRGVGTRFGPIRVALHFRPCRFEETLGLPDGDGAGTGVGENRGSADRADLSSAPPTMTESGREGGVSPRFPRDVRIEPDESGLAQ